MDEHVRNFTLFSSRAFRIDDRRGRDVVLVVAKIAYAVSASGRATLAEERARVRFHDEAWTGPWRSVRYPTDLFDEKPGTDVLLAGTATPPADRRVSEVMVGVRVAASGGATMAVEKTARVFGPRVYYRGTADVRPGPAGELRPTPLVYELTYGGRDETPGQPPLVDARNPLGSGVARDRGALIGKPVPPIEDPEDPRAPAGFGPVPADWLPRRRFAGTFDEAWRRERAPLAPLDFDPRHRSCAPPGLHSATPLEGDEAVEVVGVTPEGVWRFRLPRYSPAFRLDVEGRTRPLETHLDTFLIDADNRTVELTWRALAPVPGKVARIDAIRILERDELPPGVVPMEPVPRPRAREREDEQERESESESEDGFEGGAGAGGAG